MAQYEFANSITVHVTMIMSMYTILRDAEPEVRSVCYSGCASGPLGDLDRSARTMQYILDSTYG